MEASAEELIHIPTPAPLEYDRGQGIPFVGVDIVQFSAPIYYVDCENDQHLIIDVMRLGSMHGEVRVNYHTEDCSAQAGKRYVGTSGQIVFADGASSQSVKINLVQHPAWAATLEFKVILSEPDANCELGIYLSSARVKLMDSCFFPSNRYRHLMETSKGVKAVRGWKLLREYLKLNYQNEGLPRRTFLTLIGDQLENTIYFGTLLLSIYLVDVVLKFEDPTTEARLLVPSRTGTAIIVGCFFATPQIFSHIWAYIQLKLRIEGKSRAFLQTHLVRKYMNYTDDSRDAAGAIGDVIVREAGEVAASYTMVLRAVKEVGRLAIMLGFMISHSRKAWWAILAVPALSLMYTIVDPQGVKRVAKDVLLQRREVCAMVAEMQKKYELIADYFQRPLMNHMFVKEIGILNNAITHEGVVVLNFMQVPRHLGSVLKAVWIAWQSQGVLNGDESLGTFLATLTVCGALSSEFDELYALALELKRKIVILQGLTTLFNLPTDLQQQKEMTRRRIEFTMLEHQLELEMEHSRKSFHFERPDTDLFPLEMKKVSFSYGKRNPQILNANVSAHQSSLIAVTAKNAHGEGTLMRILSQKLFPDSGVVSIPTHLRILHVSQDPIILSLPPWENLTLSCHDADPEKVLKVVELFGIPSVYRLVQEDLHVRRPHEHGCRTMFFRESDDPEDANWYKRLSRSEQEGVHLARAFIMNPEVMMLQHPFKHLSDAMDDKLLHTILRLHINSRGIGMPLESVGRRRPRTIFFTADDDQYLLGADVIWEVDWDRSIGMRLPPGSQPEESKPRQLMEMQTFKTFAL